MTGAEGPLLRRFLPVVAEMGLSGYRNGMAKFPNSISAAEMVRSSLAGPGTAVLPQDTEHLNVNDQRTGS